MNDLSGIAFTIRTLQKGYRKKEFSPVDVVREVYQRIERSSDNPIWIHLIPQSNALRSAEMLANDTDKSLYGIPFAVKDNIDVADIPTTAGCPAFSYVPKVTATVVQRLLDAGAILIGKTNLDQFATGLVGVRSPYGACHSVFHSDYISGGSSSGSAVAVAAGLVSFALGTDTAGSGRVPAAFNNIVGLKPTRGLFSAFGVVPACRSLDCVSSFTLTAGDAATVFDVAEGFDADDPLARRSEPMAIASFGSHFRFAVPPSSDLEFFGDDGARSLFGAAIEMLERVGGTRLEAPFAPFRDAGRLLYDGPWVAERLHATHALLCENPEAILPVTRSILEGARQYRALDAYRAQYRLAMLRRAADDVLAEVDVLLLPTAGTVYETAAVAVEPLQLNRNLGLYTSFVNLLDLAAIALPAGCGDNALPFGISLIAPAFRDLALLDLGTRFQQVAGLPRGAAHAFRGARP